MGTTSTPQRASPHPAVGRRAHDTLEMGVTNGGYSPQHSTVKIPETGPRAASSLSNSHTKLPNVRSPHRSMTSLGGSPSRSPFGSRRRQPKKRPERCQFTGRKLGNRPWEASFQGLLRDLLNQEPSCTVVRCSDDPEGARLIPAGVPPETKEEPVQVPKIDTRTKATAPRAPHRFAPTRLTSVCVCQAWKLVYGKSRKADVEHLAEVSTPTLPHPPLWRGERRALI